MSTIIPMLHILGESLGLSRIFICIQSEKRNLFIIVSDTPSKPKSYKWKYAMGDRVRITMQKRRFRKVYLSDWSLQIFVIKSRLPAVPVTYQLVDLVGEPIKGKFYEQELQKVSKSDDEHFHIDRILKTRKRSDGRVEYLVSWKGYPSKFNSWVSNLMSL